MKDKNSFKLKASVRRKFDRKTLLGVELFAIPAIHSQFLFYYKIALFYSVTPSTLLLPWRQLTPLT
jgi:hypothetical protein